MQVVMNSEKKTPIKKRDQSRKEYFGFGSAWEYCVSSSKQSLILSSVYIGYYCDAVTDW